MGNTFYFLWEVKLIEWCQSIIGEFGVEVFTIVSALGEEMLCIGILGFIYWGCDKQFGKQLGINLAVTNVCMPMIKNAFVRRRPYFDNPGIKILKVVDKHADTMDLAAQGFSFPSGHASNSTTVYGSVAANYKKKWIRIPAIIIPILVGISRFVLGAHYPTDVLAGWVLGIVIITVTPILRRAVNNDLLFIGILLILGFPGFFYCTSNDFYSGYGILLGAAISFFFEEKYVNFENASNVFRAVLRTLAGGGLYLALNTLLKMPFTKEFLNDGSLLSHLVRTGRYAIIIFVTCALYPCVFKYTSKIGKKVK